MPVPRRHVLLTSQRNQLFTSLQSKGFQPEEFNFREEDNTAHLNHRSTQYFCRISVGSFIVTGSMGALETYTAPYRLVYSPGSERLQEERYFGSWTYLIGGFNNWLTHLTAEVQIPDLWSTLSGDTELIRFADDQDNKPFTPAEQLQAKKVVHEIKAYIIKIHKPSDSRLEAIEKRLSYLEEAVTRLGRFDWKNILVSTLINIVVTESMSGDSVKDLFRFAGQIVKQLLGSVLYLTGPH